MNDAVIIGRTDEKQVLDSILSSILPELVAIYGRRRVGKTYLVRTYLQAHIKFEFSGIHHINTDIQLQNFHKALSVQLNNNVPLPAPSDWFNAFDLLASLLSKRMRSKKTVVSLDANAKIRFPCSI